MDQFVEQIVDAVLGLRGTWSYVVIGTLAFGEAAAFLGLVTPGEVAMVLGGVIASEGRASLPVMAGVAAAGAVVGDSVGYWLGRRFGSRLTEWAPVARRFRRHISRTRSFFQAKGGRAVAIGRWASVAKAFVPFVAGAADMPYGRFLLFSVPSAALWAVTFVLLGFLAGRSWDLVRSYAGQAAFVLLLVIVFGLVLRWAARRVIADPERLRAAAARVGRARPVRWVNGRYASQLRWLGRRFDPSIVHGLGLTIGLTVLVTALVAAGYIFNDVRVIADLSLLDVPTQVLFARLRTAESLLAARWTLWLFTWPAVLLPAGLAVCYVWWRLDLRGAVRTALGVLGAALTGWLVDTLVTERLAGTQFPSVPVVVAAALTVHLTATVGSRSWARAVRTAAAGAFLTGLVAVASFLTQRATLTGVAFGAALGVAWATATEVQARMPPRTASPGPDRATQEATARRG